MKTSIAIRKSLISAAALTSLSAVSALAGAAPDNHVELQFSAGAFAALPRHALTSNSTFCPQTITYLGETVVVDRIEAKGSGALSTSPAAVDINDFLTVDAYSVTYTQPIDIHLKSLECAAAPGCDKTEVHEAAVTYELYTSSTGAVCMKSIGAEKMPEGLAPPEVDTCLPFSAGAALEAAGLPGGTVSGSAISLSADGSRVGVRVEMDRTQADYDGQRIAAWAAFANGALGPADAADDWSVLIHNSLIEGAVAQLVPGVLESVGVSSAAGTSAKVTNLGQEGIGVSVTTAGALSTPLCPNEILVNDIEVTAVVGPKLGASGPDGVSIHGEVGYGMSSVEAAACGLALGGAPGAALLGGVSGLLGLFSPSPSFGPGCTSGGDFDFECGQTTHPQHHSVGPLRIVRSELSRVVGTDSGLLMGGILVAPGEISPTIHGEASSFGFDPDTGNHAGAFRASGSARVCGVDFWASDGDASLFSISAPDAPVLPYSVVLPLSSVGAYEAAPFHLMATVRTSAGVRTYELPAVEISN